MFKAWVVPLVRPFRSLWGRLPSQCVVCRSWPSQPLCDACVARFAAPVRRCESCALPIEPVDREHARCPACRLQPPPLDACLASCAYVWPWPDCIAAFKFHGDAGRAEPLARLMRSTPWVEPALDAADLVLPMPLAPARLRARGFNQAYELARRLDAAKCDPHLLLRCRETAPQSGLDRQQRLLALRGAFELDLQRIQAIQGQRVVIVDDVMTTGASLYAAAQVLRDAGAAHITAIVLARTDRPH